MVVIVMKKPPKDEWSKDYDEFNVSCSVADNIGEVTDRIALLYNARLRLKWVVDAAKGLQESINKSTDAATPSSAAQVLDGPIAEGTAALKWGSPAPTE